MKLGERFIQQDLAMEQEIKRALQLQERTGGRLGDILLAITNIRALDYYKTIAQHYGMEFVDLLTSHVDLTLLSDSDHEIYLSKEAIPVKKENDIFTVATSNPSLEMIDFIKERWGLNTHIVCTTRFDILSTMQKRFHVEYLFDAINDLVKTNAAFSAKTTFATWHIIFMAFIFGMNVYLIIFDTPLFFILLNGFLTVSVSGILAYKLVLSAISLILNVKHHKPDFNALPGKDLPVFTILIPLFKEKEVTLKNLFNNLQNLQYPKHKLDIKILLEQDDQSTIDILKQMHLPSRYEFVYVPPEVPRTKAKACNYGLKLARGEYLTYTMLKTSLIRNN